MNPLASIVRAVSRSDGPGTSMRSERSLPAFRVIDAEPAFILKDDLAPPLLGCLTPHSL